mmetsp:Transcript_21342/g.36691  ORF Transcript_21342/g.36691 Transcript_21342/m.36691 type:complete len:125 (+) Transcript_21342:76-450(+)
MNKLFGKKSAPPGQVRASHILVKHKNSRRPASWKSPNGITRTEQEARAILEGYKNEIATGKRTFAQIAKVDSDCGSAQNSGDLGFFGPGDMQKPFEEATYRLEVGEMSNIISTDSGVHIILRTA